MALGHGIDTGDRVAGDATASGLPPGLLFASAWKGRRVFVLGGGPSLGKIDPGLLSGENVIGTNRAYERFPECQILVSTDNPFWKDSRSGIYGDVVKQLFKEYSGAKIGLVSLSDPEPGILYLRNAGKDGIPISFSSGVYHGNNSGYMAVQIALLLGCDPIYLLGFDMRFSDDGRSHFHGGHPRKTQVKDFSKMLPSFKKLSESVPLWRIINLTEGSRMICFPMQKISEVLYAH